MFPKKNGIQKVLLTGNAGFIGSHVGEKLLKMGIIVIGVDNMTGSYDPEIMAQSLEVQFKAAKSTNV